MKRKLLARLQRRYLALTIVGERSERIERSRNASRNASVWLLVAAALAASPVTDLDLRSAEVSFPALLLDRILRKIELPKGRFGLAPSTAPRRSVTES